MKYLFVVEQDMSEGYHGWLMKELSKLGIQSAEVEFLSLTNAYAPTTSRGKVLASEIRDNADVFYAALRSTKAKVIVPMGGEAFRAVTGRDLGIEFARGYVYGEREFGLVTWKTRGVVGEYKTSNKTKGYVKGDPRYGLVTKEEPSCVPPGTMVIPTYSVAYVITKRKKPSFAFFQDLRRAKRAVEGRLALVDREFNERRLFSTKPVIGWEPLGDRFAFDIETPMDSRDVRQISLSDGVTTMAMMWDDEVREYVRPYLGSPRFTKYAHNATFDVPRLRDAGVPVSGPVFDTMYGGQLLQPDLPKALGKMASVYCDAREWKSAYEVDPDFYSAKDSFMTLVLANEIESYLKKTGMSALAWRLMDSIPLLLQMHEEGLKVDLVRAVRWTNDLTAKLTDLGVKWADLTQPHALAFGAKEVKPLSGPQVQKLFYDWLGMETKRNKQDGITVDADALYDLKHEYPEHAGLIVTLEEYRETNKQLSTYAKTLAGLFNANKDRVHPQYLPGGMEGETYGRKGSASTGRPGVSNPNIQNQTPEARRMYVPDSPNHCFIEFDYSQAELRVIAALSQDAALLAALGSTDIHQLTSERLGIPRQLAKNTLYASCYLGGPPTIQKMLKRNGHFVEVKAIKRAQALLRQEYKRMFAWQATTVATAQAQGYLINPFDRVRFFYDPYNDAPEMADYLPQSTVADITWYILGALMAVARKYGGRVVTLVHDSFLMQVLAEHVESARGEFQAIMEQRFDNVAPGFWLPTACKVGTPGQSWGDILKATEVAA